MKLTRSNYLTKVAVATLAATAVVLPVAPSLAAAPSSFLVRPNYMHRWSTADTTANGNVSFVTDLTAPYLGALKLTNSADDSAKSQFMHPADVSLSDLVTKGGLAYSTKQVADTASPSIADASYQLVVELNGAQSANSYTTLVYEPYWQTDQAVASGWQTWDVQNGTFWSTHTVTSDQTNYTVNAGSGGNSIYTLSGLVAHFPKAKVIGYGVNIGSSNAGYDVEVDNFNFNGKTFDFGPNHPIPNAPTNLRMKVTSTGKAIPNGSTTKASDVTALWDSGNKEPVTYIYRSWYDNGSPYNLTNPWTNNTSDALYSGAFNQGPGEAHFDVIAVDQYGDQSAPSKTFDVNYQP